MLQGGLNLFEGIVYINLSFRRDRRKLLTQELKTLHVDPKKIFRIEGIYDELNGTKGCLLSHIKAIDFALQKKWKTVLILEDDCTFIQSREKIHNYINHFFEIFKNDWDVFFLGTDVRCFEPLDHPSYLRVQFSMRAHAYVVHHRYLTKLKVHYLSTFEELKRDIFFTQSLHKALDRKWVDLQLKDRWYCGKEILAAQRRSFSDIEKEMKGQR